jgi:hypothetical protein
MRLVGAIAAVNGSLGFGLLRTKLLRPCHHMEPRKPQRGFTFWNVRPRTQMEKCHVAIVERSGRSETNLLRSLETKIP